MISFNYNVDFVFSTKYRKTNETKHGYSIEIERHRRLLLFRIPEVEFLVDWPSIGRPCYLHGNRFHKNVRHCTVDTNCCSSCCSRIAGGCRNSGHNIAAVVDIGNLEHNCRSMDVVGNNNCCAGDSSDTKIECRIGNSNRIRSCRDVSSDGVNQLFHRRWLPGLIQLVLAHQVEFLHRLAKKKQQAQNLRRHKSTRCQ